MRYYRHLICTTPHSPNNKQTNKFHWPKSFLRSEQLLHQSWMTAFFFGGGGCTFTAPYKNARSLSLPERDESTPRSSILLLQDPFKYYPHIYTQILAVAYFLQVKASQPCVHLSPHACCMPRPFHPQFHQPKKNWWRVRIMKILITRFSPACC